MDEAHALKDKNSFRWKNLMSVARNANQRLMLTGTPLQNDLHVCITYVVNVSVAVFSFNFILLLNKLLEYFLLMQKVYMFWLDNITMLHTTSMFANSFVWYSYFPFTLLCLTCLTLCSALSCMLTDYQVKS